MRTTYLVCYDIADEKRLRRVFKACKARGEHLQFSVFECDLSPAERQAFENELRELINSKQDQILFVALGRRDSRPEGLITAIGLPYTPFDAPCYTV